MAQQINLFSPLFLRKRKYFSALTMVQAMALLLGGILAFYGYVVYETRQLQRVASDASAQLAAQSASVAKMAKEYSPQGRSRVLEDEVARLGARLKQREDILAQLRHRPGQCRRLRALPDGVRAADHAGHLDHLDLPGWR